MQVEEEKGEEGEGEATLSKPFLSMALGPPVSLLSEGRGGKGQALKREKGGAR